MNKTIDVTDLKPEQIAQLQDIIETFKAKNQLEQNKPELDLIDYLTENPVKVDGFLTREEIYDRQG
jgi:hypothetical protein